MTCREFVEFVWQYVEDQLRPEGRAQFETHLAACPHCVKYLQSYRETTRLGKFVFAHPEDVVPAEVPEDLVRAILASRARAAGPAA